jgi:hypothetical protein
MRAAVLAAAALALLAAGPVMAGDRVDNQAVIRGCITAAARVYRLPPAILVILLDVERGALSQVSANPNRTVDIGPMQINQIWLPEVAAHWHATMADAYDALRDNFCANVEAGAWILRRSLDEAHGDFWQGVSYYHSHTPEYQTDYLRGVWREILRLRSLVEHSNKSARPPAAQGAAPVISQR